MKSRYLTALQESANVLGLTSAVALSAALLNPLPLLVGLVAEAAYLIFIPDCKWYMQRLSRLNEGDVQARRDELKAKTLPKLRATLQNRFAKLEETRQEIERVTEDDASWMREVLRKLDFLLEKFLQFAVKDEQFRVYLYEARTEIESEARNSSGRYNSGPVRSRDSRTAGSINGRQVGNVDLPDRFRPPEPTDAWVHETVQLLQASFDREMSAVKAQTVGETDEGTLAILQKRLEVLQRRRDFIAKIGKIIANLSHQLSLLEDTFGLISDELLARPPEQVLADIDDVVSQTNTMTQVLEEMAPYERLLSGSGSH